MGSACVVKLSVVFRLVCVVAFSPCHSHEATQRPRLFYHQWYQTATNSTSNLSQSPAKTREVLAKWSASARIYHTWSRQPRRLRVNGAMEG